MLAFEDFNLKVMLQYIYDWCFFKHVCFWTILYFGKMVYFLFTNENYSSTFVFFSLLIYVIAIITNIGAYVKEYVLHALLFYSFCSVFLMHTDVPYAANVCEIYPPIYIPVFVFIRVCIFN